MIQCCFWLHDASVFVLLSSSVPGVPSFCNASKSFLCNHTKTVDHPCTQVVPGIDKKKASADSVSLVEVGPRVCLNPIKIFGGSFGGPVLFDNPHFVSPNRVSTLLSCHHSTLVYQLCATFAS